MATDTGQKFRDAFGKLLDAGGDSTAASLIDNLTTVVYRAGRGIYSLANADATKTTTWATTLDDNTSVRLLVTSAKIVVDNALTAANTDTAVFSLVYNNGNGGSDTTIATINTATTAGGGSGDMTAGVPVALSITAANQVVPSGSQIQFKQTKQGNGIGMGTYTVVVKAKPV